MSAKTSLCTLLLFQDFFHQIYNSGVLGHVAKMSALTNIFSISQTNRFQVVAGFDTDNSRVFVLYQYEDGMMQWSSTNSEVSLRICEVEWNYEFEGDGTILHNSIISNTNVNENGRYAFLFKNGNINPAGKLYRISDTTA